MEKHNGQEADINLTPSFIDSVTTPAQHEEPVQGATERNSATAAKNEKLISKTTGMRRTRSATVLQKISTADAHRYVDPVTLFKDIDLRRPLVAPERPQDKPSQVAAWSDMGRVRSFSSLVILNHVERERGAFSGKRRADGEGDASACAAPELVFVWWLQRWLAWMWGGSKHSGTFCLVGGALLYSLMRFLVKLLAVSSIPSFQTVMFRSIVVGVLSLTFCIRAGNNPLGHPRARHILVARALIGFLSLSCFFYSIQRLPLRDAAMLNFTMPVFTAILGRMFLREQWRVREICGSFVSLAGVLLVTQSPNLAPGFPAGLNRSNLRQALTAKKLTEMGGSLAPPQRDPIAVCVGMLGAGAGAGAYILIRQAGKTGEPSMVIVFVFALTSVPLSACGMLFQEFLVPTPMQLVGLAGVGVAGFGAQVLVTRGLQLERASKAAYMQYISVLATYILGVVFLGEIPTFAGVAGALLVAISASFVASSGNG